MCEARGVKARDGYDERFVAVDMSLPIAVRSFRGGKLEAKVEEHLARYLDTR